MEKIYLTQNEKYIIKKLSSTDEYQLDRDEFEISDLDFNNNLKTLSVKNIAIGLVETNEVGFLMCQLTDYGIAYINFNPTLENPLSKEEIKSEERQWQVKQNRKNWIVNLIVAIISSMIGFFIGKI